VAVLLALAAVAEDDQFILFGAIEENVVFDDPTTIQAAFQGEVYGFFAEDLHSPPKNFLV
jgi:hypothetical protein